MAKTEIPSWRLPNDSCPNDIDFRDDNYFIKFIFEDNDSAAKMFTLSLIYRSHPLCCTKNDIVW